jgi:hypothetical protein
MIYVRPITLLRRLAGQIRLDFVLLEINQMTLDSFEEGER